MAKLEKMKADKKISEVYSEKLVPSLTLSSTYMRSFKKQVIQIFGQAFEIGSDNTITSTFDVSEPIPILGTPVFSGIRIAEYYAKLQEENINKSRTRYRRTSKNHSIMVSIVALPVAVVFPVVLVAVFDLVERFETGTAIGGFVEDAPGGNGQSIGIAGTSHEYRQTPLASIDSRRGIREIPYGPLTLLSLLDGSALRKWLKTSP